MGDRIIKWVIVQLKMGDCPIKKWVIKWVMEVQNILEKLFLKRI